MLWKISVFYHSKLFSWNCCMKIRIIEMDQRGNMRNQPWANFTEIYCFVLSNILSVFWCNDFWIWYIRIVCSHLIQIITIHFGDINMQFLKLNFVRQFAVRDRTIFQNIEMVYVIRLTNCKTILPDKIR